MAIMIFSQWVLVAATCIVDLCAVPVLAANGGELQIYVNGSSKKAVNDSSCWDGGKDKPCSNLNLGLLGLEEYQNDTQLIIEPGQYTIEGTVGNFRNLENISIVGSTKAAVNVSCEENKNGGLSFEYSEYIKIQGISFIGCEQPRNTTSTTGQDEFMITSVSLYFLYCGDVTLEDVTIRDISGIGVVMYNLKGDITVKSCLIHSCGNGGLYLEYSYCVPYTHDQRSGVDCLLNQASNVDPEYNGYANIDISDSKFIDNHASLPNEYMNNDTFILPHKQHHSAFGRGGGISAFFKGNSSNNTFLINNCEFRDNSAIWGGGIFAEFQDAAHSNSFIVTSSNISNNKVTFNESSNTGTGGGGSRVGFIYFDDFFAYNNSIIFDNCTFDSNEGYFGGGISLYSAREPIHSLGYNGFTMKNCAFINNRARIGSATDLSTWHASNIGAVLTPIINSCTFVDNSYPETSKTTGLIGIGALYVDTLHVKFSGINSFFDNSGTALAVTGGYITIDDNCTMTFIGNTGRNGGGIALLGNAYMITSENTNLTFISNRAMYHGGAIYFYSSGERDLISSRNCFIRYSDINAHPNEWKASFTFKNNTLFDNSRNAIHTPSVLSCLWGGAYGQSDAGAHAHDVFCWNKNWDYGSDNCVSQISSDAFEFDCVDVPTIYNIPGQVPIDLSQVLKAQNELHRNVTQSTIYIASLYSNHKEDYRLGKNPEESFVYVTHEELYLYGKENTTIVVQLETLDPIVIRKTININFTNCPAGFSIHDYKCTCDDVYKNFLVCNSSFYYSLLFKGDWYGKCPSSIGGYCVGEIPYMNLAQHDILKPYINLSNLTNEDDVCGEVNRTGVLCAHCKEGYCMDVNSEEMKCIPNDDGKGKYGWLLLIATTFIPVTIFFLVIFIFSSTVTSGPLNSYIFFAQVITTSVKIEADGMIPLSAWMPLYAHVTKYFIRIPYEIWNLNFKNAIPVSFCLMRNDSESAPQSPLFLLSLEYLTALYPLILLFFLFVCLFLYNKGIRCFVFLIRQIHNCFSRLRLYTGIRQSIAGGVAIFIIISYTKFTLISILLLSFSPLYGGTAPHNNAPATKVFFYDGNKAWPRDGIPYVIIASLVLVIFVAIPPLLLVYLSLLDLIRKIPQNRINLGKLYPGHKIQVFLNEFHGCYKDGSNPKEIDCRWFASLYFCLRIAIFTMYGQIEDWNQAYLAQVFLFIIMASLFFILRPYHQNWINLLDGTMFLNLALICVISLYNSEYAKDEKTPSVIVLIILFILVFFPLIYCIGFYFKLLFTPAILRCLINCYKKREQLNIQNNRIGDEDGAEPPRMDESTGVEPFLDYVEDGRRRGASFSWNKRMPKIWNTDSTTTNERTPLLTTPPVRENSTTTRSTGSRSTAETKSSGMNSGDSVPAAHDNNKLE